MIDIMNTPEQYVLFGLISIIVIIIVIAYMWSKVQRRRVQDAMEDIDSRPDNRRKRSREMLDRLIETKQQIAQNQTIVQTLIEARDEARCRLTSMERKYQTMYENAGIGIARLDATYRYIEVNQYYAQIYGYESPETFMDMNPFFAYVCPFFHHNHEHMLLHESKTMIKNDCHHVARDDVSIVVRNTFVPVLSENGDVEFYDLFSENVTEETRTRQELEQSNRALDAEARKRAEKIITMEREHTKVFNAMKDWIMVLDRNLIVLLSNTTNDEFARPGSGRNTCVGVHVTEAYPALSQEALQEYKQVIETKKDLVAERKEHIAGTDYIIEVKKIPILDAAGNVDKIVATARDITRRRIIETKLAEANANLTDQIATQYRLIVESSPIMLAVVRVGRIVRANDTFLTALGYTEEEVYVRNMFEFIVPEYRQYFAALRPDVEGSFRRELQLYVNQFHGTMWVDIVAKNFMDSDGQLSQLCIMVDVTEKKNAMNELVTLTTNIHQTFSDLQRANLELQETHAMLQEAYAAQYDTNHKLDAVMKSISDTSFILDDVGYVLDTISTRKQDPLFNSFIQHAKNAPTYTTHISAFFTDKYTVDHIVSVLNDALLYDRIQHLEFTTSTPVGQRSFMALITPILGKRQVMISLRDSGEVRRLKGLCESVLSAFGALIRYTRRDDALKRSIEELVGRFDILSGVVALIEPDGSLQYVYSCGIQYDMEQAILQATSMIGNMGPMFQTVISGRQYLLFIIQEERRVVGVLGFIMSDLWIPFSTDRTDDQELLSYYAESLASFLAHRT